MRHGTLHLDKAAELHAEALKQRELCEVSPVERALDVLRRAFTEVYVGGGGDVVFGPSNGGFLYFDSTKSWRLVGGCGDLGPDQLEAIAKAMRILQGDNQ